MTERRPLPSLRETPRDGAPTADTGSDLQANLQRRAGVLGAVGLSVGVAAKAQAQSQPQGLAPPPPAGSGSAAPGFTPSATAPGGGLAPLPGPVPQPAVAGSSQPPATLRPMGIQTLELSRGDEGLALGFVVNFELPRTVEEALLKGIPLHFTAQAQLLRERWYWTDRRVTTAVRGWRLTYQPLTRRFRVGQGGLAQNLDDLESALAACSRATGWRIAEPGQIEEGSRHYVEFRYRLDTSLLPRPMQIGIGGQPDWNLGFERTLRVD